MDPKAQMAAFELLAKADLMDRREMKSLHRFSRHRSTPSEYQERAAALLAKLEAS